MKKKLYIQPWIKIQDIENQDELLTASEPDISKDVDPDPDPDDGSDWGYDDDDI